jgi:hypothetical protein
MREKKRKIEVMVMHTLDMFPNTHIHTKTNSPLKTSVPAMQPQGKPQDVRPQGDYAWSFGQAFPAGLQIDTKTGVILVPSGAF